MLPGEPETEKRPKSERKAPYVLVINGEKSSSRYPPRYRPDDFLAMTPHYDSSPENHNFSVSSSTHLISK